MKNRLTPKSTRFTCEVTPERVLTNWMEAICLLHQNYVQLSSYLTTCKLNYQSPDVSITTLGQCPFNELQTLLNLFEVEIEKLLQDVTLSAKWDQAQYGNYTVLIDHTLLLNQLNNQAQTRIYLLSLPSS